MVSYYNVNTPYIVPYTTEHIFNNPYYNPYLPNAYSLGENKNDYAASQTDYISNQSLINTTDVYKTENKKSKFNFLNWYRENKDKAAKIIKGAFIGATLMLGGFFVLRAGRFIQPSESSCVSNFHTVSAFNKKENRYLYRGAKPDFNNDELLNEFKEKNIKLVIDFRNEKSSSVKDLMKEREIFTKNGIKYVNFPMESGDIPDKKTYNKFQEIINKYKKDGSIFIHCKSGIDRTGVMSAMYQMENNHKTKQQVYEIMKDCGYNIYHQQKYKKLTKFMEGK